MWTVALLALLFAQDARALVEQLRSDSVEERDDAFQALLKLGAAAAPELRKAAVDRDLEVAGRAKRLLRILELREAVPPRLRAASPGIEERLALDDDRIWTEEFFKAVGKNGALRDELEPEDAGFLVARALRGARTDNERYQIARMAGLLDLRQAVPELVALLRMGTAGHAGHQGLVALRAAEAAPAILEVMKTDNAQQAAMAQRTLVDLEARSAAPGLMALLEDPRPLARANAAVALGELGIRDAAPLLVRRLAAALPVEAGSVLRALGKLKHPDSVQPLRDYVRERKPVASEAAEALGEMGAKEAIPDLLPLLETDDADSAAQALGRLGAQEAVPALIRLLKHEDEYTRAAAATALGRLDARASAAALRPLLKDADSDVVHQAALALARFRDAGSIGDILESLEGDDDEARDATFEALARFDAPAAVPALSAVLARGRTELVRRAAALLLARLGRFEALQALAAESAEPAELRATAVHALGAAGGETAQKLLSDPNELVRAAAAWTLGRIGRKEAVAELGKRLADGDEEYDVRCAAARALGAIRDPRCVPLLLEGLKNEDLAGEAARALGRQGSRAAAPALLKLLETESDETLDAAAGALARLDRDAALAKLRERLKSAPRALRGRVASALCRLGDRSAAPVLLAEARRNPLLPLDSLNALRQPELWRRLEDRFAAGELLDDTTEMHVLLSRLIGWPVDSSGSGIMIFAGGIQRYWDSVPRLLEDGLSSPFVIDEGRVRVFDRAEGLRFWKDWEESTRGK